MRSLINVDLNDVVLIDVHIHLSLTEFHTVYPCRLYQQKNFDIHAFQKFTHINTKLEA